MPLLPSNVDFKSYNSIESKFGKGIASRLNEICIPIKVEGEDQRKSPFKEFWKGGKK